MCLPSILYVFFSLPNFASFDGSLLADKALQYTLKRDRSVKNFYSPVEEFEPILYYYQTKKQQADLGLILQFASLVSLNTRFPKKNFSLQSLSVHSAL